MIRLLLACLVAAGIGYVLGVQAGVRAARTPWPPEAMQADHEEPAQGHAPVHGPANDWVENMMDEINQEDVGADDE